MARFVCALLLLAVATASASESRIVGGLPSSVERHPSVVQVQSSLTGIWRQTCAGSVLTSRNILTAASCVIGPEYLVTRLRRVRAGTSIRNTGGQISTLFRIVKHPSWNEGRTLDGDIAILQLETPLQYSIVVQQATILGQGIAIPDNMPAFQVGWGATLAQDFPAIKSPTLLELNVFTVNLDRCAINYATLPPRPITITSNMVCASSLGESGACVGDKGGPLFINDITVGIVSFALSCSNGTFPTVHTAVPSYTNWIIANAI